MHATLLISFIMTGFMIMEILAGFNYSPHSSKRISPRNRRVLSPRVVSSPNKNKHQSPRSRSVRNKSIGSVEKMFVRGQRNDNVLAGFIVIENSLNAELATAVEYAEFLLKAKNEGELDLDDPEKAEVLDELQLNLENLRLEVSKLKYHVKLPTKYTRSLIYANELLAKIDRLLVRAAELSRNIVENVETVVKFLQEAAAKYQKYLEHMDSAAPVSEKEDSTNKIDSTKNDSVAESDSNKQKGAEPSTSREPINEKGAESEKKEAEPKED